MLLPSPLLLHLTSSFLISSLRLTIEPENFDDFRRTDALVTPFILISPNRNISFSLRGASFLADTLPLSTILPDESSPRQFLIAARCEHGFALRIHVGEAEKTIPSPSFCANHGMNEILIGPDDRQEELFYGCIRNVTLGGSRILDSWCRLKSTAELDEVPPIALAPQVDVIPSWRPASSVSRRHRKLTDPSDPPSEKRIQPIYVGESVSVLENDSTKIAWKNIYLFPEHRRFRIKNTDVRFDVLDGPTHGVLQINEDRVSTFTYDDIIARRLEYVHDGSESTEDSFDITVLISSPHFTNWEKSFNLQPSYTVPIRIEPRNDAPQLLVGPAGRILNVAPGTRMPLTSSHLKVWDADSATTEVCIEVRRMDGVHLTDKRGISVTRFTLAQLLNEKVYIVSEAASGEVEFRAMDSLNATSQTVTLRVSSVPVEIRMEHNTGIRLPHRASQTITSGNLSFTSNFPDVAITYAIVDQPQSGMVECAKDGLDDFRLCAKFSQDDVSRRRVRYRHTSENKPKADSFSFQVHSGDATSGPHVFHIDFMPVSVRVFIQESLLLNNSEQAGIGRRNLLASTYPQNFPPEELIYHVVEPPKFGMLSRRVEGGKQRRIGVSSNFSQQHVDEVLLTYKLHFVHYSVVSDFFVFRLVTPAAVSELLRFDITYIPGGNSLHLLNRTLVVSEGGTQQITNNSLWLETADDTNFVFTIAVPPFNGRFVLVNDVGAKFIPGLGGTFTSFDILSKRLFYEHSGDESRSDRAYLLAESIYRQNTRIPLWFSITIIAENDHAPEPCFRHPLDRVHSEIHLVDGGERVFHSSLLCWRDQDADNGHSSLSYYFPVLSKDFMISARESLELPIGNFTQKDLDSRRLVIRQLSMKREMTLRYAVSDGKYVANGSVTLIASDPFLRLSQRQLELPHGLEPGLIPVSIRSLAAGTNLDVDPSEIRFELHPGSNSPFRLLSNDGLIKPTSSFYQRDIERHRVFLLVGDSSLTTVPLSLKVADKVSEGALTVTYSDKSGLSFHVDPELRLAPSSVLNLDSLVLRAQDSEAADVKFLLIDQPKHGSIVLQMPEGKLKSARPSNNFIMGFRQSDLDAGLLQYLHSGTPGMAGDSFTVNISVPTRGLMLGPVRFNIVIEERAQLGILVVKNITLTVGANVTLDSRVLRLTDASSTKDYQFRIANQPSVGKIVSRRTMQPIQTFSRQQLTSGDVLFVSDENALPAVAPLEVKACEGRSASVGCSEPVSITIRLDAENYAAPELIRNEPLFVISSNHAVITEHHLKSLDPDTASNELKFLIWQPIGGFVARISNVNEPVQAFSQRDVDDRNVAFVLNGSSTGGFSFLVTDGVHQTPSEWFSVERASKMDIILEANSKLNVPPGSSTVIASDHLRSKASEVQPEQIIYRITRAPVHGRIVRSGSSKAIETFTQADINDRLISYKSDSVELGSWSQRDYFNFAVSTSGYQPSMLGKSKDDSVFRFRVLVSFAHLTEESLWTLVAKSTIHVGRGGTVAINSSHVDLRKLSELSDDQILVEVVRSPKHGSLSLVQGSSDASGEHSSSSAVDEALDEEPEMDEEDSVYETKHLPLLRALPSDQFHSGRHVLYRHVASADSEDEVHLQVYALRERHRRARLRIRLSVEVLLDDKSSTKIEKFREELNVVSGGAVTLDPADFQTTDPHLKPSEVVYRVTQRGTNGVHFTLSDGSAAEAHSYTQAQINKGQVRLEHRPMSEDDKFDVVVLQVGTDTRALIIRVEPLALHLFNHSDITYVQGKTYIVMNRGHLGANSNGDRSRIIYNVTKPPENGTFYWVAGEKQANTFTQKNIDDGDVLYAQLNMNAFQDYFEFTVGNEDNEKLERSSKITVLPAMEPHPLVVHSNNVDRVGPAYLNASKLEGTAPRYLVVTPPTHGRLFLHPNPNESVVFFTHSNILDGDLYFHSFEVEERIHEDVVLELRSDNVQPARFTWLVEILPTDSQLGTVAPGMRPSTASHDLDTSKGIRGSIGIPNAPNMAAPDLNYRFPLVILAVVVISVLIILLCRRNKSVKKSDDDSSGRGIPGIGHRELPPIDAAGDIGIARTRNDLLDTTVYASIGRQQHHRRGSTDDSSSDTNHHRIAPTHRIPNHVGGSSHPVRQSSAAMSTPKPTFETFEGTPPVRVQPLGSGPSGPPASSRAPHMYKATALAAVAAARMGSSSIAGSAKLKDSQYWV